MYIEKIKTPADLKGMDIETLNIVADETRQAVLNRVSKHGGHVGPILVSWRLRWRCITSLMHRRTSWCLTSATSVIRIRC